MPEPVCRNLKGNRLGRQDWQDHRKDWETGSDRKSVGPLYGYLASIPDLEYLDPNRKTVKWEARSYQMVTNDTAVLKTQLERSEVLPGSWRELCLCGRSKWVLATSSV